MRKLIAKAHLREIPNEKFLLSTYNAYKGQLMVRGGDST